MDDEWMKTFRYELSTACKLRSVSLRTLYRLIKKNKIKILKVRRSPEDKRLRSMIYHKDLARL